MSSTYAALCLSHDPALVVSPQWQSLDMFSHAYKWRGKKDDSELVEHSACDLLVGRWSGGLVQVGCPPNAGPQPLSNELVSHYPYHPHSIEWVDVCWLRLRLRAQNHLPASAFADLPGCWRFDRLWKLNKLLFPEGEEP